MIVFFLSFDFELYIFINLVYLVICPKGFLGSLEGERCQYIGPIAGSCLELYSLFWFLYVSILVWKRDWIGISFHDFIIGHFSYFMDVNWWIQIGYIEACELLGGFFHSTSLILTMKWFV